MMHRRYRPTLSALACAFAAAWISASATPTTAQKEATPAEIEACLREQERNDDESIQITLQDKRLQRAQRDIQRLVKLVSEDKSWVQTRNPAVLAAYNKRVKEINELTSRANDQVLALMQRNEKNRAASAELNKRCTEQLLPVVDIEAALLRRIKRDIDL